MPFNIIGKFSIVIEFQITEFYFWTCLQHYSSIYNYFREVVQKKKLTQEDYNI